MLTTKALAMILTTVLALHHATQELIDNKVIVPPTRPSITNNPLPNHNFRKRPRINFPITEKESTEDPFELIYDLPKCFMMTWEELMDRTSSTTTRSYIWNEEIPEPKNNQTLTNGVKHFKHQSSYSTPTNGGRHLKPQVNSQTPINRGRHFKP